MMKDVVDVEIHRVRSYATEVLFAAAAGPGSLHYAGDLPAREVRRACNVAADVRSALQVLEALWFQPGPLASLRRCLMRRPVLQQLQLMREQLDEVRVGHHVRWEAPADPVERRQRRCPGG